MLATILGYLGLGLVLALAGNRHFDGGQRC